MHGVAVSLAVHRHRAHAHPSGGPHHTAGNLPPVGDQNLLYPPHPYRGHIRDSQTNVANVALDLIYFVDCLKEIKEMLYE